MTTTPWTGVLILAVAIILLCISGWLKTDRIGRLERRIEALERSSPVKP